MQRGGAEDRRRVERKLARGGLHIHYDIVLSLLNEALQPENPMTEYEISDLPSLGWITVTHHGEGDDWTFVLIPDPAGSTKIARI